MTQKKSSIPVVIFCGGKGTRLKEETEFKPKPMVSIGGKPILWHIMKTYSHYGYNNFILCLGYKGDMIKEFFLNHKMLCGDFRMQGGEVVECFTDYEDSNFEITFADTGEDTPTGERLLKVQKYITSERFMVTYGDGVSNINIDDLASFHDKQNTLGTITGVHPSSKYGLVRVDDRKVVTAFEQKPLLHDYVNGGYMVFGNDFFRYLKADQMIEEAIVDAVADNQVSLFQHDGYWQSMDTYQDYQALNEQWIDNPQWRIWA